MAVLPFFHINCCQNLIELTDLQLAAAANEHRILSPENYCMFNIDVKYQSYMISLRHKGASYHLQGCLHKNTNKGIIFWWIQGPERLPMQSDIHYNNYKNCYIKQQYYYCLAGRGSSCTWTLVPEGALLPYWTLVL